MQRKVSFWQELDGELLGPAALGPRCQDTGEGLPLVLNTDLMPKNLKEVPLNWTLMHIK